METNCVRCKKNTEIIKLKTEIIKTRKTFKLCCLWYEKKFIKNQEADDYLTNKVSELH